MSCATIVLGDKEILDWIEEHLTDVAVFRDVSRGNRYQLGFDDTGNGCPREVESTSFREAAILAMGQR